MEEEEEFATAVLPGGIREAAHLLGISARSAYRAAARGDLPAIRISPRRWVVPVPAWKAFLSRTERLKSEPTTDLTEH